MTYNQEFPGIHTGTHPPDPTAHLPQQAKSAPPPLFSSISVLSCREALTLGNSQCLQCNPSCCLFALWLQTQKTNSLSLSFSWSYYEDKIRSTSLINRVNHLIFNTTVDSKVASGGDSAWDNGGYNFETFLWGNTRLLHFRILSSVCFVLTDWNSETEGLICPP